MSGIKAGDVVALKCGGGQKMAVRCIRSDDFSYFDEGEEVAICQWFHEGELKTKHISLSVLERIEV